MIDMNPDIEQYRIQWEMWTHVLNSLCIEYIERYELMYWTVLNTLRDMNSCIEQYRIQWEIWTQILNSIEYIKWNKLRYWTLWMHWQRLPHVLNSIEYNER